MKKLNNILMRNNSNGNNKVKTRKNKNVCAPFVIKGNTQTGMARCLNSKGKRTKKCKIFTGW